MGKKEVGIRCTKPKYGPWMDHSIASSPFLPGALSARRPAGGPLQLPNPAAASPEQLRQQKGSHAT